MKTVLRGAVAAIALVSMGGVAQAQTAQLHYAGGPVAPLSNPSGIGGAIAAGVNELALLGNIGTRYTAAADAPSDTTPATPVVSVAFKLTGKVNKDCSFYAGNNSGANDIDFGVIGVRTGNNENVSRAFEMVGKAEAEIKTLTAGCNFNNTVEITKNSADGLVNAAPGGYDSDEFQANIPYSVKARWMGTANQSGPGDRGNQELVVGLGQTGNTKLQGAWRSALSIAIEAPVVERALVAGNYEGTLTLKLSAS